MLLWQIWDVGIYGICNVSFEHCTGPVCIQWQNASCLQFAVCRMRHNLSSWASIMCLCSVALHKHMSSGESHGSEVKILTRSAHWRKAIQSALEKSNTRQVHWRKAIDLVQNTICTFLGSHTVGAGWATGANNVNMQIFDGSPITWDKKGTHRSTIVGSQGWQKGLL